VLDWLNPLPASYGLAGIFLSALLSATLLPGNSELALLLWLQARPDTAWSALAVASLGNTLGSLTSFWLGRRLAHRGSDALTAKLSPRALHWLQRHGSTTLLLAWLPLVGDALCLAAGWLRLPPLLSALYILLGKTLRYLLIVLPFI